MQFRPKCIDGETVEVIVDTTWEGVDGSVSRFAEQLSIGLTPPVIETAKEVDAPDGESGPLKVTVVDVQASPRLDRIDVEACVENVGEEKATQDIRLIVIDTLPFDPIEKLADTESVTISPGETETVSLRFQGDFLVDVVRVESDSDQDQVRLRVR